MAQYIKKLQSGGLFKANGKNYNYQDVYNEVQSQINGQKIDKNLELGLNYLLSTGKLGNYGNNEAYSIVNNALAGLAPIEIKTENSNSKTNIESKEEKGEKPKKKLEKFSNSKSLDHYIRTEIFGDEKNAPSVMTAFLNKEKKDDNGYDNTNRAKRLLEVIDSYLNKLQSEQYDFSNTRYKTQDNYIKAIQGLRDRLTENINLNDIIIYSAENQLGNFPESFLNTFADRIKLEKAANDPIAQMRANGANDSQINEQLWQQQLQKINSYPYETTSISYDLRQPSMQKLNPEEEKKIIKFIQNSIKNNDGNFNQITSFTDYQKQGIFKWLKAQLLEDQGQEKKNPIDRIGYRRTFAPIDEANNYVIINSINTENGTALIYNPVLGRLVRTHISQFPALQDAFKDMFLLKNGVSSIASNKNGGILKAQKGLNSDAININNDSIREAQHIMDLMYSDLSKLDTTYVEQASKEGVNKQPQKPSNPAERKNFWKNLYNLPLKDQLRFITAISGLASAIDQEPTSSAVLGIAQTLGDFGIDMFDSNVSRKDMWKNLGINTGFAAASTAPVLSALSLAKRGKEIGTLAKYVPALLGGAIEGASVYLSKDQYRNFAKAWSEISNGDINTDNARDFLYGLQAIIGTGRSTLTTGTNLANPNKLYKDIGAKEHFYVKETNGTKREINQKQYNDLNQLSADPSQILNGQDVSNIVIPKESKGILNFLGATNAYKKIFKMPFEKELIYDGASSLVTPEYQFVKRKNPITSSKRTRQVTGILSKLGFKKPNLLAQKFLADHENHRNLINGIIERGSMTFDEYKKLANMSKTNADINKTNVKFSLRDALNLIDNDNQPSYKDNIVIARKNNTFDIRKYYVNRENNQVVFNPTNLENLRPLNLNDKGDIQLLLSSTKPSAREQAINKLIGSGDDDTKFYDADYDLQLGDKNQTIEQKLEKMIDSEKTDANNDDNITVSVEEQTIPTVVPSALEDARAVITAVDTNTETSPQIKKQQETKQKNNKRKKKKHNNGGEINYSDKLLQLSALRNGGIVKAQGGLDTRFLDEYSKLENIPDWYKNIYRQDHLIDWKENLDKSKSGTLETYPLHHLKADLKSAYILNNAYTSNKDAVGQDIQNYYTKRYNNRSLQDFVDAYNKDAETIRNSFSRNDLTYKENNDWSAHNQLFWDMFANRSAHNAQNLYDLGLDQKSKNILGSTTWHRRMDRYSKQYKDLTDEEKKSRIHRVNTGKNGEYGYVYKEDNGNIYIPQDDELKRLGFELFSVTRPAQTTEQENRPITSTEPVENQNRPRVTGETLEQSQENADQANGDNNEQNGGYVIGSGFDILNRNKGKFSNWFQFVPKAAEAALLWSSNASNNKRANIAKQKKPGIVNPLTIFRNTYRNLYGEQAAQQQANNMMSSVGQRQTSDSSLNIASRLDAQRIVNDAVTNAKNASNQVFNQTAEFQRQADLQTLQSHLDAQNRNSAALTENNNYKIDVEAARLAANQENIKNILTGWIYEQKAKAEELQALRRNLGERFIDYRMQQELSNDPAYQQALLKYQEAYQADAENSTEETIRELKNASTLLQAAINNSKARAIQNKINRLGRLYTPPYFGRNYKILDDIKNLRKGGRMYGSKIDDSDVKKRTKDHDRLAKQVIASLREFNKATDRLSKGQFLSIKKMLS